MADEPTRRPGTALASTPGGTSPPTRPRLPRSPSVGCSSSPNSSSTTPPSSGRSWATLYREAVPEPQDITKVEWEVMRAIGSSVRILDPQVALVEAAKTQRPKEAPKFRHFAFEATMCLWLLPR